MNQTTNNHIRIDRRPLTHYIISVTARGADVGGDPTRLRTLETYPVSVDENGCDSRPLSAGEKIISCVPAVPGSVEVYALWTTPRGKRVRSCLGVEVPSADNIDWVTQARKLVSEHPLNLV